MVNYALPGMYELFNLNMKLMKNKKKYSECFLPNININAFYGNFQYCSWDGGRIFHTYKQTNLEQMKEIIEKYNNEFKIPIRYVFTNVLLKEKDCYNRFENILLEVAHSELNEIVINSPILENYIRKNYPKYNIISSTTKCLINIEKAKEELIKEYKFICLDFNLNHNKTFLENIPQELKPKTEFLVNAICESGCPTRKEHYRLNSFSTLNYGKVYKVDTCNLHDTTLDSINPSKNVITPKEIEEYYVPNGFTHFKLEGRSLSETENACNYVKYLVKPEHQLFILNKLLQK